MKKNYFTLVVIAMMSVAMFSCKKNENTQISEPLKVVGQAISDTILPKKDANNNPIPLKGTMLSGKTYHIMSDVTVNAGDTLYIQPGVKVLIHGDGKSPVTSPTIYVNGNLVSDGSKEKPNWFTVFETSATPKSNPNISDDTANDPAYRGYWGGFQCGKSANLLLLRWSHIEYTGGPWGSNAADYGFKEGDSRNAVYMNSGDPTRFGKLIVEDSWFYGNIDDCVGKCENTYVSIMRNTLSKMGSSGGEAINLKSNCYGDMAYNLTYGVATNGLKIASIAGVSTIVNIYNNTVVNNGFRQLKPTRNGSINTETNAGGYAYNNIIVNCKAGLRISYQSQKGKPSDTLNTKYGNNLTCIGRGTPMGGAEQYMQFIEPGQYTLKQATDFNGYMNGAILASGDAAGTNTGTNKASDSLKYDPLFANYDVKVQSSGRKYRNDQIPAGADFHLKIGSSAIGAGVYLGGAGKNALPSKPSAPLLTQYGFPMKKLPIGGTFGANITPPNKDLGAFPSDGSGNQHTY
jgi:hypothetical protein